MDLSEIDIQTAKLWYCSHCSAELGELNGYCVYCKEANNVTIYNPDKYYIREIRIRHICGERSEPMTPQEELFSQLFNHEKLLVKDMDILTLRAHREELSKIAFEARARLTAVDDEDNDRKKKKNVVDGKPSGFSRSVNTDETTTNAINVIKERQRKLTGKEKMLAGLIALYEQSGLSKAEAEAVATKAMGARTILERVKDKASQDIIKGEIIPGPSGVESFTMKKPEEIKENKPMFNPFAKKE